MKDQYQILKSISEMDAAGIVNEDLYITGTLNKLRLDESVITPRHIAELMKSKFTFDVGDKIFDPCAGRGGLLELFKEDEKGPVVFFNDNNDIKKELLKIKYPRHFPTDYLDSLVPGFEKCRTNRRHYRYFDKVMMNPPFNKADNFLLFAMNYWLKDPGGELVTLYPKLGLARLKSNAAVLLSMLSFPYMQIEDVHDCCGYPVDVALIHLKR